MKILIMAGLLAYGIGVLTFIARRDKLDRWTLVGCITGGVAVVFFWMLAFGG